MVEPHGTPFVYSMYTSNICVLKYDFKLQGMYGSYIGIEYMQLSLQSDTMLI